MNKDLEGSLIDKENQLLDVPQMEKCFILLGAGGEEGKESHRERHAAEAGRGKGEVVWVLQRKAVLLAEENLSIQKELEECKRNNIQAVTRLQWSFRRK